MILSTKGRYAVMAMVELAMARDKAPMPLSLVAERQDIPSNYLEQIVSSLRKAGLLQAVRGPGGGYALAKPAAAISIADVIDASDENMEMTRCGTDKLGCKPGGSRCVTHDLWEGLTEHIQQYLDSISLADVINGKDITPSYLPKLYQVREPV